MREEILTLLIVEDEQPIRDELAQFPWESDGILLVGTAVNGRDALDFCLDLMPDIVLTDITMPGMSGLELMRSIRETDSRTQFIILTCHADFRYAREALRLGAVDYIMKVPTRDQDIHAAVCKAKHNLEDIDVTVRGKKRDEYWKRSMRIRETVDSGEMPPGMNGPSLLFVLHMIAGRQDFLFINQEILKMINERREEWFDTGEGRYGVLIPWDAEAAGIVKRLSGEIASEVRRRIEESMAWLSGEFRIFGSMSGRIDSREGFRKAWEELQVWKDGSFYEERRTFFSGEPEALSNLSEQDWRAMDLAAREAEVSPERVASYLSNDFLVAARQGRYKADQLKTLAVAWRERWKKMFGLLGVEERFLMRISGVSSLSDLSALLIQELKCNGEPSPTVNDLRPEVQKAVRILNVEYNRPLSLTEVADRVGLSAPYLSRLFKEQVGETFNEYLTDVRIKTAVGLLRETTMRVYEIAGTVGFPSYRYFSALFKGITGKCPKEYRRGTRNEN